MTRARTPSGSPVTTTSDRMYAVVAVSVTGIEAVDASSTRDASDPRKPIAVE